MRHTLFVLLVLLPMTTFAFEEFVVKDMRVDGLQRISEGTVFNYLPINIGDKVDNVPGVPKVGPKTAAKWLGAYDSLDFMAIMKRLTDDIESGRFADEWDAESESGYQKLDALREQFAGPAIQAMEAAMRSQLGPGAHDGGESNGKGRGE